LDLVSLLFILQVGLVRWYDVILLWPKCWAKYLNLTLISLDTDGRACSFFFVGVICDLPRVSSSVSIYMKNTLTLKLVVAIPCVLPFGKVMMIDVDSSDPVLGYFVIALATFGIP
jgi:hypothetical protein